MLSARYALPGGVLVMLLLCGCIGCAWQGDGKPDGGIQMQIQTTKADFREGEDIRIRVTFRNERDEPVELAPFDPWGGELVLFALFGGDVEWSYRSESKVHVSPSPKIRDAEQLVTMNLPFQVPPRGESVKEFVLSDVWYVGNLAPGNYKVWVDYESEAPHAFLHLISNVVKIRVLPTEGK